MLDNRPVVIDFEAFRYKNKQFVVKELSICGEHLDHIIFQPPKNFDSLSREQQKSYTWLTKNLHGLHWCTGKYPYTYLNQFLLSVCLRYPQSKFYTKGLEKKKFLQEQSGKEFIDLTDLSCPKVVDLEQLDYSIEVCDYHCAEVPLEKLKRHCSFRKVQLYYLWLLKNLDHEYETVDEYEGYPTSTEAELITQFGGFSTIGHC